MNNKLVVVLIVALAIFLGWLGLSQIMNNSPSEKSEEGYVVLKTNMGDITLDLYEAEMPITTANFLKLAEEGFYNGTKFHRVIKGFMIQGGDPLSKDDNERAYWGTGGPGYTIEDEFGKGLSNIRGTISMANTGQPNSGGSQFFINLVDNTNLDFDKEPLASKHPVFGRVVEGMDIVDKIANLETGAGNVPLEDVIIDEIIKVGINTIKDNKE